MTDSIRDKLDRIEQKLLKLSNFQENNKRRHLPRKLSALQQEAVELALEDLDKPFTMMALIAKARELEPEAFGSSQPGGANESVRCFLASLSGLDVRYAK